MSGDDDAPHGGRTLPAWMVADDGRPFATGTVHRSFPGGLAEPSTVKLYRGEQHGSVHHHFTVRLDLGADDGVLTWQADRRDVASAVAYARRLRTYAGALQVLRRHGVADGDPVLAALGGA